MTKPLPPPPPLLVAGPLKKYRFFAASLRVTEAEIRDGPDTVPGNLFRSRKKNSVAANLYPPRFQVSCCNYCFPFEMATNKHGEILLS